MKRILIFTILVALAWIAAGAPAHAGDSFVVVVHKDAMIDSIERKELSGLFLKLKKVRAGATELVPIDLGDTSRTREAFTESVHERSLKAVNWYWQKKRFSMGVNPPAQATSESNMLRYISSNPNAIGYVAAGMNLDPFEVKAIRVTD